MPPSPTGSVPDTSQIYPPREDTFFLLRMAQAEIRPDDIILEVGTGSGYIASSLQDLCTVIGTDINPHAVLLSHTRGVQVIRTDMARGLRRVFTMILFNPPYIPTDKDERIHDWLEYALDGGTDGRAPLARFLVHIPEVLAPGGRIMILISSLQDFHRCEELFSHTGFLSTCIGSEILEDGEKLRIYILKKKD
ncbi:MAG TPA: methylase [Methanospirillum sp.]|uniref:HemK2/MTQ2 family protein methyltransferase n=1 Tax=Methanospirillum sp. TaxID=45200 RepID=UPI002D0CB83F|nr:HemK2/MTQ2 family protein methyltransferase [Methanospirillum sp.]HOJ95797.1 methylase [Methanospirillum sp.]HPP78665.1 methylase [Methanospirillum sp.]